VYYVNGIVILDTGQHAGRNKVFLLNISISKNIFEKVIE
jgi:hypothetical protein